MQRRRLQGNNDGPLEQGGFNASRPSRRNRLSVLARDASVEGEQPLY